MNKESEQDIATEMNQLKRTNRKLAERLNRISNLAIGRRRIWQIDEAAQELTITADFMADSEESEPGVLEAVERLRVLALGLSRTAYDLSDLRTVVRGDSRRMSRTDPRHWRGERP